VRCPRCGSSHAPEEACSTGTLPDPEPLHPAAQDPLLGSMVGSFRIRRLLGRGGMGSVYLGEHPVIGSRVAIKFLHESLAANPELVGRFYDEARAVNLIGHENIVGIYDLALLPPGRYYIVMEYLEGETLAALLRRAPVDQRLALDVLLQLTGALQAAHERGIVHRDLKPENVFLIRRQGRDHFVKLVDFGIAKLGDRSSGAHTAAGMIVGTPEYMAPEQCDSRPVNARSDVYALGIMAYEVATGRLPFTAQGVAQVLLQQLREQPDPPGRVRQGIHAAFESAILRALEKRPEDRFPDMRAFGEALRLALEAVGPLIPAAPALTPAAPQEVTSELPQVASAPPVVTPVPAPFPPAPPAPAVAVSVEVRAGGASRRFRVAEVSRGGLFLVADGELPSLLSKVAVLLRGREGRKVTVSGEVVRHVSAAQAAAWHMETGFAVQTAAVGEDERLALDELALRLRAPAPTPARHPTIDGVGALQLLESLEFRAAHGHYDLLDARLDDGLPEIRERGRALRRQVEDLRVKLPPAAQIVRVAALLERIEHAAHVLGTPAERLLFDARRGNFRGVARCVTAGVTQAVVAARRSALLAERPGQEAEAQRRVARAQVARKMGNDEAARAELEAALTADPLNLDLHRELAGLERALADARGP
jgi:serine/threonine-protein kinase